MGLAAKVALGDMSKRDMLRRQQARVADLQNQVSFVQNANRNAGSVFSTSGYRTVSDGDKMDWAMDWSLTRLANHRTMENIIRIPNFTLAEGFFDGMPADKWSTVVLGAQVRKKGRSTGWTRGIVNSIEAIMGNVGAEYGYQEGHGVRYCGADVVRTGVSVGGIWERLEGRGSERSALHLISCRLLRKEEYSILLKAETVS
jgi:hypothetical protein